MVEHSCQLLTMTHRYMGLSMMECTSIHAVPVNYDQVNAEAFRPFEHHSTIAESLASSFDKGPASINMVGTLENLAH